VSDPGDAFLELSSDQRTHRLRRLAARALERYDLITPTLTLITGDWNCVFRVATGDGGRSVLRVNLPRRRTRDEVGGEMAWLASLAADGSVRVPAPIAARDGSLVIEAVHAGVPEPRMCVLFGWLEGARLADVMTPEHVAALGEATAGLHRHARSFPVPPGMQVWDSPFPFREAEVLFDQTHATIVDDRMRGAFERTRDRTVALIEDLLATEPPRMLHADLHEDNAFVQPDGRIAILDFDDAMAGWPVQDLSVTVWALAAHPRFEVLEAALREGYERVEPWPEREPGEIRTFAASRSLHMANHTLQEPDPDSRARAAEVVAGDAATIERLLPA
jgi:Ser/Thr protein kinase RdoA (MazF antagonist)